MRVDTSALDLAVIILVTQAQVRLRGEVISRHREMATSRGGVETASNCLKPLTVTHF